MTNRSGVRLAGMVLCLGIFAEAAEAQKDNARTPATAAITTTAAASIDWKDALKQRPEWYGSDEAVRIADNVLLYQRDTGGWSKNIEMARMLTEREQAAIDRQKRETDSNIDNGATFTQLIYLARVYTARKLDRHKEAYLKGIDYLLEAQYDNGGWPQYYPARKGYYQHITFNDDAMMGVMRLLRDIALKKSAYAFVDENRRCQAEKAVQKGVELILKTQVIVDGKRTIWAAQHDEVTLAPAAARKFEPVSLSGGESVAIVRFLMGLKQPSAQVIEAIESAIDWYKESIITGIRWVERRDASKPGGFERIVVKDPKAAPIWARFYEIRTNRPIFIGRDGVIKYNVDEIDEERRNGYSWYVSTPAKLIEEDYSAWQKKGLGSYSLPGIGSGEHADESCVINQ